MVSYSGNRRRAGAGGGGFFRPGRQGLARNPAWIGSRPCAGPSPGVGAFIFPRIGVNVPNKGKSLKLPPFPSFGTRKMSKGDQI